MLIDYKTSAAYICPICSKVTARNINIFDFSGRRTEFHCSSERCGTKCVSVRKKKSNYIFDIECPVCSETHSFSISCDGFWEKEFMTFLCPASDVEIFFKGNMEDIHKALDGISERNEISDGKDSILYDMIEEIYMLGAEHAISCTCGNEQIEVSVLDGAIALVCKRCGAAKIIDVNAKNYKKLCETDGIIINKGK